MLKVCLWAALLIPFAPALSLNDIVWANITADTDGFGNVDGRGSITDKAEQLGLSMADVAQIRASVGYVICPASEGGNPIAMSAALVGTNMQIVTAAHAFIDYGGNVRTPLSECYFRNQAEPYVLVMLDVDTGYFNGAPVGVTRDYDFAEEWAVVALKEPITNVSPFRLGKGIGDGDHIIAIAAHQKSPPNLDPHQPVVQSCRKRDQRPNAAGGLNLYTDCDLSPLASGGPMLSRAVDGEFLMQGLIVSGGTDNVDGLPYSLLTGSFARAVPPIDGFGDAIREVGNSVLLLNGNKVRSVLD